MRVLGRFVSAVLSIALIIGAAMALLAPKHTAFEAVTPLVLVLLGLLFAWLYNLIGPRRPPPF